MSVHRRFMLAGGLGLISSAALAQHSGHAPPFERLNQAGRVPLPDLHREQSVLDSPAPKAARQGRWVARAELPLPRTEMAWAAERAGKLHLIGGYAEQRVDKPYHHVYDPSADRWTQAPDLPRGANHVGVAVLDGAIYAFGGFIEQNRTPHGEAFVFGAGSETWRPIAPLPRPCGAIACVALDGVIHLIGGAEGNMPETRKSIDWHYVYDPKTDRYTPRAPMPLGRDHTGVVATGGRIHLIAGRVDSFHTNSALHHVFEPREDRWRQLAPIPTPRSGHGCVLYRGRIHCMGGEGTNRVFGSHEAYDLARDRWEAFAPMLTPRHGTGAVAIGDWIYVAGGGPIVGGGIKSAVNEAFTLG